jgi:hypothetical protein
MFILSQVTKWVDQRDSTKRAHKRDIWSLGYRTFLLNPSRFVDIKLHGLAGSCFKFSDNDKDRREGTSYLETNSTVAAIIAAHNTPFFSKMITLPFYPKNNPHKVPVNVTLDVEDIAYFDDYNDPNHPNCCWVVYNYKGFKRIEQLVGYSLEDVEDILLRGETTSTP